MGIRILSIFNFRNSAGRVAGAVLCWVLTQPLYGASVEEFYAKIERNLAKRHDLIFVGNSILGQGIDVAYVSNQVGQVVSKLSVGGAASAWWYLVIKNYIVKVRRKPRAVMIFFRDEDLTRPKFRTTGKYKPRLDYLAQDDPIYDEIIYGKFKWLSLAEYYRERVHLRVIMGVERAAKLLVGKILGFSMHRTTEYINAYLGSENMNKHLLGLKQLSAEAAIGSSGRTFENQVENSFLPVMVSMLNKHGIKAVFIRCERLSYARGEVEVDELKEYMDDLQKYLANQGALYWNFAARGYFEVADFAEGDHMNRRGRAKFSSLIAKK